MNPLWQTIVSYAAFLGGLYLLVTRPIQAQLSDIQARLGRIEADLKLHGERITRLEERTSPLQRSTR